MTLAPLRRYRIDAGMTTSDLAQATGVGMGTINSIENGSGARVATLVTLSAFLSDRLGQKITPSELLAMPTRGTEPNTGAAA